MWIDVALSVFPAIILFLFGIEQFSGEILKISGERFRNLIKRLTRTPVRGLFTGTIITSLMQSSAATMFILLGLINSGVITFAQSLGVMLGGNIGTAITAQLIAFKITFFAPFLIIIGFLISVLGGKYKFIGKPLFYFGLVFFSLSLISSSVAMYKDTPEFLGMFSHLSNFALAILIGIIVTNLFQSSLITTGLIVVFTLNGLITFEQALPVVLGANIGTTFLAFLISRRMNIFAQRLATAHFIANLSGVIIVLLILPQFSSIITYINPNPAIMVANAHLLYNMLVSFTFIILIKPFQRLIEYLVKGDEKEVVLGPKYLNDVLPENNEVAFDLIEKELKYNLDVSCDILNETFNAIKTKKDNSFNIYKLETLIDIIDDRIIFALLELSKHKLNSDDAEKIIRYSRLSNSIEQLADLCKNLNRTYIDFYNKGVFFDTETLLEFETNYLIICKNFYILSNTFPFDIEDKKLFLSNYEQVFKNTNTYYKSHIKRMTSKKSTLGSYYIESMAILENINDKLLELSKIIEI